MNRDQSLKDEKAMTKQPQQIKFDELLQNVTRINIFMYLKMNASLSFGEIVRLTKKSKSTVHHHLQKLIKGGLVQEVIKSKEPRNQFDPKHYELVPAPRQVYDFSDIAGLDVEEKRISAFLTTTKLHQHANFYLHQILDIFNHFLDGIDNKIAGNDQVKSEELQNFLDGKNSNQPLDFKDIYYYSNHVSEEIYQEYLKGLDELNSRISELTKLEKQKGEIKGGKPYFLYHVIAPLGKKFIVKPDEGKKAKKKVKEK